MMSLVWMSYLKRINITPKPSLSYFLSIHKYAPIPSQKTWNGPEGRRQAREIQEEAREHRLKQQNREKRRGRRRSPWREGSHPRAVRLARDVMLEPPLSETPPRPILASRNLHQRLPMTRRIASSVFCRFLIHFPPGFLANQGDPWTDPNIQREAYTTGHLHKQRTTVREPLSCRKLP